MQLLTRHKEKILIGSSFFIPVVVVLFFMITQGYHPFGDYSYGISDNFHQYMPFFLDFRRNILNGDSLLYNWNIGMGIDYIGLIPYYLASPLNLLGVLFSEEGAITYYALLMPIRLGLASLFFSIFLWKSCGKLDPSLPLFGCFYGMCAWALGYQWNCMWLDTFALTPLVILGALNILKRRRFILYTITLFFSVAINYYIGFFVCIFVLLVFICYQVCSWEGWRKFFCDIGLFALWSSLAIAMTGIITIPAFAALQKTYSSINQFPSGFQLNIANENTWIGLIEALAQVAGNTTGGLIPTFKNGLPNIYCGIGILMLAIIFLLSRQISKKERVCAGALLLFMALSFVIRQLDYIWHGFHFTNQIPYRFSFLFSFLIIATAYKMWLKRRSITSWQIYISAVTIVVLTFPVEKTYADHLVFTCTMVLLYLCVFILLRNHRKVPTGHSDIKLICNSRRKCRKQAAWIMVVILFVELLFNYANFENHNLIISLNDIPQGGSGAAEVINYMKESDKELFYRAEVTHTQTYNDAALNDFHGISTFTSTANVNVTRFMQAMGFAAKDDYNRYLYEESSPVANLFLGLKYMISRDGTALDNQYFDPVYTRDDIVLLKNNAYLPIGFMVDEKLAGLKFEKTDNPFAFQNALFSIATGERGPVWIDLTDTAEILAGSGCSDGNKAGSVNYEGFIGNKTIVYRYEINASGLFCVGVDFSNNNNFTVYKNGKIVYSENEMLPQVLSVSNVKEGDLIELIIYPTDTDEGRLVVNAAVLNDKTFLEGYEKLSRDTMTITKHSNTSIEGFVKCTTNGLLYTSIPQNGSWSVWVDGKEAEIKLIGNAMIGVCLNEGEHNIQFKYKNESFIYGSIVSGAAVCLFIFAIFLKHRSKTRILHKSE